MPASTKPGTKPSANKPSTKPSTKPGATRSEVDADAPGVNLAVLCGPCSGPAEVRVLESGTRLATLAVRCPAASPGGSSADDRATSVPVTVWDPPAWVETLAAGDPVVVVGRMRRRFYQRPGGVGSRVDVEAELVGRARDRRRIDAALRRADQALEALG
jgi:single-stranded DNA-binding protein